MSRLDIEEETVFLEKTIKALQQVFEIPDSDGQVITRHFSRWRDRLPQHKNIQIAWARYMQGIYGKTNMLTMTWIEKQSKLKTFLDAIRELELDDYSSPAVGHIRVADSNGEEAIAFGVFGNYASY